MERKGKSKCKYLDLCQKKNLKNIKNGETLSNYTRHKAKTNSVGFCFFNIEDFKPEEALHFMTGVATLDVCAVFETDKELKKTYGIYAKPIDPLGNLLQDLINLINNFDNGFEADEYCTTAYSNKDFKLVKYSENVWEQWKKREGQSELKWKKI